jgi:hypothetical protein
VSEKPNYTKGKTMKVYITQYVAGQTVNFNLKVKGRKQAKQAIRSANLGKVTAKCQGTKYHKNGISKIK